MSADETTLWPAVLADDREAFAALVRRYQAAVSGVAYSVSGDLWLSEDIAQQTFVTAWSEKARLRDPARVGQWLRGIARNLARRALRRREPRPAAAEDIARLTDSAPDPAEALISREQAELLWSILERIPARYREPLVLYHREERSVEAVARSLGLSEDAVKQRLSRGRRWIAEELAAFVERGLSASRPGHRFVHSVLAALPGGGATAGKAASTLAGATLLGELAAFLGPLIGIAGGIFGSKRSLDQATSQEERRALWRMILLTTALVLGLLGVQWGTLRWFPDTYRTALFQVLLWTSYSVLLFLLIALGNRRILAIKAVHGTEEEKQRIRERTPELPQLPSRRANLLGVLLGATVWCGLAAGLARDPLGLAGWALAFLVAVLPAWSRLARVGSVLELLRLQQHAFNRAFALSGLLAVWRWPAWLEVLATTGSYAPGRVVVGAVLLLLAAVVNALWYLRARGIA
jgi:RNA polymerase sigma factor (sigma-70 family)